MPIVKLPSGETAQFPDEMPIEAIQKEIEKTFPNLTTGQKVARAVAPYARPVLEYGGMTAGGMAGTPLGPAGNVGGAALGYGIGKQAANKLEEYAGTRTPQPLNQELAQAGMDVATGAGMEMGGQVIGKGIQAGAKVIGEKLAPKIYESVLKAPPGSISLADRKSAVQTALESKYAPTEGGLKKLQGDIDSLNERIKKAIDSAVQTKNIQTKIAGSAPPFIPVVENYPQGAGYVIKTGPDKYLKDGRGAQVVILDKKIAEGNAANMAKEITSKVRPESVVNQEVGTIDMKDVVARVDDLKKFYKNLPDEVAEEYIGPLTELQKKFASAGSITPQEAQSMKQTLYALNRKHYGELKGTIIEGNKAIARGLKEELVKQVPEIASLNAQDSARINLENILERAVKRTRNWDILGLTDLTGSAVGGVVGGRTGDYKEAGKGAALGLIVTRALRDPAVASRLAFAISKSKAMKGKGLGRFLAYGAASGGPEPQ
jgi:hypothetical protein